MKTVVLKTESIFLIWPNSMEAKAEINTINKIRDHRNERLISLLDGQLLKEYLFFHFRIRNVSENQIDEIRKMLMGVLLSPLDLHHYCTLIRKISNQASPTFTDKDELYFHYEIETLIGKYYS